MNECYVINHYTCMPKNIVPPIDGGFFTHIQTKKPLRKGFSPTPTKHTAHFSVFPKGSYAIAIQAEFICLSH